MDTEHYIHLFQKAAEQLNKKTLADKQVEVAVGLYQQSVFLKLYKRSWANPSPDPLSTASRIFFSIWIDDQALKQGRMLYNIHALKLRQLKGYAITSRAFAEAFRKKFKKIEAEWPNVSVAFGPLTLMQGWQKVNPISFQEPVMQLSNQFLEMDHIIDSLLKESERINKTVI